MQDAVPPLGTALREVTRKFEESEGHARVCGLFSTLCRCTCRAKSGKAVINLTSIRKLLINYALGDKVEVRRQNAAPWEGRFQVQNNAY